MVYRYTDKPGSVERKIRNRFEFTVPVFLQYVISSSMHEKVWFSYKILTEIDRILNKERFQKAKDDYLFLFPATGHTFYPRTPIDTPGRPIYG